MAEFRKVARVEQVPEGQALALEIEGRRIALFNLEGEIFALDATCAQHGAPLAKGIIDETGLHCPWHGVTFDVSRGLCSAFPGARPATRYPVRVEGEDVLLEL